jgi:hypothetical protein
MPFYYLLLLCVLLFALGWLFRKPLASRGANFFVRILAGLFGLTGVIAWTFLLLALAQFGNAMGGAGDGAGTERSSNPPQVILLVGIVWLVPVTGFVFMLLGSLDVLKGTLRSIGYWYALIFLVIVGGVMMVLFPHRYIAVKGIGLACLLMAVLWSYTLRKNTDANASMANPNDSQNLQP